MPNPQFDDRRVLPDSRIEDCLQYGNFITGGIARTVLDDFNIGLLFFCLFSFGMSKAKCIAYINDRSTVNTLLLYAWVGHSKRIEFMVELQGYFGVIPNPINEYTKIVSCKLVYTDNYIGGGASAD